MADPADRSCDVLIVSSSDKMSNFISKVIPDVVYGAVEVRSSSAMARRELVSRDYDMIMINIPLADESATDLAIDISSSYSAAVVLVSPADICEDVMERVSDSGILVIPKPVNRRLISHCIRFMCAIRDKYKKAETKAQTLEEKMDEIRIVNRAKLILIETEHMSEDDAHRYIGKQAMDRGVSRGVISQEIISLQLQKASG